MTAQQFEDAMGEKQWRALCLLSDLATEVAELQRQFVVTGGRVGALRYGLYAVREIADKLAEVQS